MRSLCRMALAGALAWLAPVACEGAGAAPVSPVQIGLRQGDLAAVDADPLNARGALSAVDGRIP